MANADRKSLHDALDKVERASSQFDKTDLTRAGILRAHLATTRMWVDELYDTAERAAADQEGAQS